MRRGVCLCREHQSNTQDRCWANSSKKMVAQISEQKTNEFGLEMGLEKVFIGTESLRQT